MGAVEGEIILIRMRLSGGQQVAAEAQTAAGGIAEVGAAAEASSARATRATSGIRGAISRMAGSATMLRSVGRTWTTHFTLPIVAGVGLAVKSALDFHESMTLVETQAGASAAEVHNLTGQVLDFASSGQTTSGPNELAQGLYAIESAGIRGARAMAILRASSDLALIGHSNLADTTKALVAAQKTGIKGSSDLRGEIGTLNATVGSGQMHMEDLLSAMGTGFLSSSKQVGLNLSDVGGALAELTKQGIPASAAATRLRMTFTLMAAPSDKAKAALAGIGLGATDLAETMRNKGLLPALQLLHSHLSNLSKVEQTQVLSEAFGGARSGTTIMALVNNLGDLDSTLKNVHKHAGDVGGALAAAKADPAIRLRLAWAQFRGTVVKLGDALIPVVIPALIGLAAVLTTLVNAFVKLPGPVQAFIGGGIVLAAVFGPVIWMLGAFAGAIDAVAVAFGIEEGVAASAFIVTFGWILLLAAAALGFVILYEKVKWFRDGVNAVIGFIVDHWRLMVAIMFPVFGPLLVFIIDHFDQIKGIAIWTFHAIVFAVRFAAKAISFAARLWFGVLTLPFRLAIRFISGHFGGTIKSIVSGVFHWLVGAAQWVGHTVSGVFGAIGSAIGGAFDSAISAVVAAINWLIGAFNSVFDRTIDTGVPGIPVFHGMHLNPIGGQALEAHNPKGKRAQAGRQHGAAFAVGGLNPVTQWARVGERGQEDVLLPAGARVFPHEQSPAREAPNLKATMKRSGDGDPGDRPVYLVLTRDGRKVIAEVTKTEENKAKARA